MTKTARPGGESSHAGPDHTNLSRGLHGGLPDASNGNGGDQIAAATAIYEGRLLLEAGRVGIETLINRTKPASIAELNVVLRLLTQAGDALDAAQREMFKLFGVEIGHA